MQVEECVIIGSLEEINIWKQALNTVTGGGTPSVESKADYQTFRWAMVENLSRIDKAIEKLRLEVKDEHERILAKHCGSVERFNEYRIEAKVKLLPFNKYLLPTGVYELPGSVQQRFQKVQKAIADKYPDIEAAGNAFAARQAEMFAAPMIVSMVCCDYTEVPDDINAGYLEFLSKVIMGRPRLRNVHPSMKRKQRFDKEYAAELLAKVTKALHGSVPDLACADVAAEVLKAIFGDSAKES